MKNKLKKIQGVSEIPVWIIIGTVLVLLPIFSFVTYTSIKDQRQNQTNLLIEKGAALIRSFEAGTRTGMMGRVWGNKLLQRLLAETARQPDIEYILVAKQDGTVIYHSKIEYGQTPPEFLPLKSEISNMLNWRVLEGKDGLKVFEVYRKFLPRRGPGRKHHMKMKYHYGMGPDKRDDKFREPFHAEPLSIHVGFDMTQIESSGKKATLHSIFMGGTLLVSGAVGILLLFFVQSYRSARVSLSRVRAFSNIIVSNMPVGLIVVGRDFEITSINRAGKSILGVNNDAINEKSIGIPLPFELKKNIEQLDDKKPIIETEFEFITEQGVSIPLSASSTILSDEEGNSLGYVILLKDLTEINSLRDEVARNQRLASVGMLAAGVAHEIRNPLSSVKGFATYFRDKYSDNPDDKEVAQIMIQEVDRLNRVVTQLLEFSKPVKPSLKSTDLKEFIENSLLLIRPQAIEKNISISSEYSQDLENINIDNDLMNQVFLNLYLNAVESMENGGALKVIVKKGASAGTAVIEISDTGCGIDENDLPHIFDPYFTTRPAGSGIGLSTVHKIIDVHCGEIKTQSKEGEGTTFTITLPGLKKDF